VSARTVIFDIFSSKFFMFISVSAAEVRL